MGLGSREEKVELLLQRMDHTDKSSYGVLFDHYQQQKCFIIEDTQRDVKVDNETRIPAGFYQLKYREVLSDMTKRYRSKYDWFTWHLELQDVPDFEYCYFHIGNRSSESSGCGLTNYGVQLKDDEYVGLNSTPCFKEVYQYISELLDSGIEVWVRIQDEDYFKQPF